MKSLILLHHYIFHTKTIFTTHTFKSITHTLKIVYLHIISYKNVHEKLSLYCNHGFEVRNRIRDTVLRGGETPTDYFIAIHSYDYVK